MPQVLEQHDVPQYDRLPREWHWLLRTIEETGFDAQAAADMTGESRDVVQQWFQGDSRPTRVQWDLLTRAALIHGDQRPPKVRFASL